MLKDIFQNRLFIGALVFFVFCVGGSLLYMWHVEREGAEYDAETQDRVAQWNAKQNQQPPAEASVGDTSQGGHFHADGTWHGETHDAPAVTESSRVETETPVDVATPTPTGPLTYHGALLASHPVEALRAQAAERGHWSEKWIPPFPPDDHEAAALARTYYLTVYYRSTGETGTPKADQVWLENRALMDKILKRKRTGGLSDFLKPGIDRSAALRGLVSNARGDDLLKLSWVMLQSGDIDDTDYGYSNFPLPGMTYIESLGTYHHIDIGLLK